MTRVTGSMREMYVYFVPSTGSIKLAYTHRAKQLVNNTQSVFKKRHCIIYI